MFYGAKPAILEKAKFLRENMTESERILWREINKNQLGVRFKPQHPIATFIVDFYCHELLFVIEIDGDYHKFNFKKDQSRTDELEKFNLSIIRFKSEEVVSDINSVIKKIVQKIEEIKMK